MDIVRYLLAKKSGISKQFALLWALDIISVEAGSKTSGTEYLKLSNGGRLLLSGYGNNVYLAIQSKEDS